MTTDTARPGVRTVASPDADRVLQRVLERLHHALRAGRTCRIDISLDVRDGVPRDVFRFGIVETVDCAERMTAAIVAR